jgi:hypothetical protein
LECGAGVECVPDGVLNVELRLGQGHRGQQGARAHVGRGVGVHLQGAPMPVNKVGENLESLFLLNAHLTHYLAH